VLLDQVDHRVGLGHTITDRVLGEHHARTDDDSMAVLRPDQAAVVDGATDIAKATLR
jgi:hypothetical protein